MMSDLDVELDGNVAMDPLFDENDPVDDVDDRVQGEANPSPKWNHDDLALEFVKGDFELKKEGEFHVKKEDEITVRVSHHPTSRKFAVKLQRALAYEEVPVLADTKFKEDEENHLMQFPFRIVQTNGVSVSYTFGLLDGAAHPVGIVSLNGTDSFKIVFTRNGCDFTGRERAAMKKVMKGKVWNLQLCETDNLKQVIASQKIQVVAEVRRPSAKKRKSNQDDLEAAAATPAAAAENPSSPTGFGTSYVVMTMARNSFFIPLGQYALETGLCPSEVLNAIESEKAAIRSDALTRVCAHFGFGDDFQLPAANFFFTLRTIGDRAKFLHAGGSWAGGPLELLTAQEFGWTQPAIDEEGRQYHVVDLHVDVPA